MSMKYINLFVILPPTERSLWFFYIQYLFFFSSCKRPCKYLGLNIFGKCKSVCNTQCIMIRLAKASPDLARNRKTVGLFGCVKNSSQMKSRPGRIEPFIRFVLDFVWLPIRIAISQSSHRWARVTGPPVALLRRGPTKVCAGPQVMPGLEWNSVTLYGLRSRNTSLSWLRLRFSSSTTALSGLSWRLRA